MPQRRSPLTTSPLIVLVALTCIILSSLTGSALAAAQGKPNRVRALPPVDQRTIVGPGKLVPPDIIPEFSFYSLTLGYKQGILIGPAITHDLRGNGLLHYQQFREPGAPSTNSAEMHSDGSIFISTSESSGPIWYDTYEATDTEDVIDRMQQGGRYGGLLRSRQIACGRNRRGKFEDLKSGNVHGGNWRPPSEALPFPQAPTRWFTIEIPRGADGRPLFAPANWSEFIRASQQQASDLLSQRTPQLAHEGDYCFWDTFSPVNTGGPPQWATIMPRGAPGEKLQDPDHPRDRYNNPISWNEVVLLMQRDPQRGRDLLRRRIHPDSEDYENPIPWVSASVNGLVTNSFLSGEDWAGNHQSRPDGYWQGTRSPFYNANTAGLGLSLHLSNANDYVVFVKPDPEYEFMLARRDRTELLSPFRRVVTSDGNFGGEHNGELENEIEQWLVPVGFRPEPGDRIHMTGRWVVDCGHENWQAEIHPYESYVSSHVEHDETRSALDHLVVKSSVVITGAWSGGTLGFDIWPVARPSLDARLRYDKNEGRRDGIGDIREELIPADGRPNHLHVTVTAPFDQVGMHGDGNDVAYSTARRLASHYYIWWEDRRRSPARN